ncbi:hypothetical protein V5O48_009339 [Marasmius crinis-equi]|uniref:F-box domain-containing protein n=1 Tax=Marasmius crinis-equi TaxID=585013 RepID=A0ABR3FBJ6_9AGAR
MPLKKTIIQRDFTAVSSTAAFMDAEISRLQASLHMSQMERAAMLVQMEDYRGALSPVRHLPDEIQVYVFRLCVDGDVAREKENEKKKEKERKPRSILNTVYRSTSGPRPSLNTRKSPWVFSYVCHRWRQIALSIPQLWSSIEITWMPCRRRYNKQLCDPALVKNIVALRLGRAQDQPLAIKWCDRSCNNRTFAALCSRSFNWEKVTISSEGGAFQTLWAHRGTFSKLYELQLHFEHWPREDAPQEPLQTFLGAADLRNLTLSGLYCKVVPLLPSSPFPWSQITKFTISHIPPSARRIEESCYVILPLLGNVRECSLAVISIKDEAIQVPKLTLRHLHTLVLATRNNGINPLLDSLTLPALRTLELQRYLQEMDTINELIDRSSCQFSFQFVDEVEQDGLFEFFRERPLENLRTLTISA